MFRLILLNKLLEDGNTLYRQAALGEASTRYRYAVRRLPREGGVVPPAFSQLHTHLLLNLSRCERRRGQFSEAATLASQVTSGQTFLLLYYSCITIRCCPCGRTVWRGWWRGPRRTRRRGGRGRRCRTSPPRSTSHRPAPRSGSPATSLVKQSWL